MRLIDITELVNSNLGQVILSVVGSLGGSAIVYSLANIGLKGISKLIDKQVTENANGTNETLKKISELNQSAIKVMESTSQATNGTIKEMTTVQSSTNKKLRKVIKNEKVLAKAIQEQQEKMAQVINLPYAIALIVASDSNMVANGTAEKICKVLGVSNLNEIPSLEESKITLEDLEEDDVDE